MGRLYRRNSAGPYYGDYYTPEGKRVRRCLKTTDKAVAKERLRLAELAGTSPQARGRRQRLMEAIDDMIQTLHDKADGTIQMYEPKGRRLYKTLGNPYLHEITLTMLEDYVAKRRSKDAEHGGAKLHTIAKELITVRRACKHAVRHHILPVMPTFPELGAKYTPKTTWLTAEQFERMCAELPPDRQLWASIAALAGGCYGEVERVEWGQDGVDLARDRMHLPGTKREARNRWVPIAPALRHRLESVPEKQRKGRVVAHWGNVRRDLHAAVVRANQRAQDEATKAGLEPPEPMPRVSPNDLRRTFGSWLVQQGVPTLTVAILMGHSSTRMVELVYGRLTKQNLETAIAVLPVFGKKPTEDE